MLRLRVRSIGSGTESDPFRAPIPTYVTLDHDEDNRVIVVAVPASVHPFTDEVLAAIATDEDQLHGTLHVPTPEHLKTLHEWWDDQYQEHKGEFRVNLA